jgi:hypothetical protein
MVMAGGQALFALGMAVCTALYPSVAFSKDQGGVSNYALKSRTAVPYGVAFAGAVVSALAVALSSLPVSVRIAGGVLAPLFFLAGGSAYVYMRSSFLHKTHFALGGALLTYELFFSVLLLTRLAHPPLAIVATTVEAVGDVLCLLALPGWLPVLFTGQVLASLGFAAVLLLTVRIV